MIGRRAFEVLKDVYFSKCFNCREPYRETDLMHQGEERKDKGVNLFSDEYYTFCLNCGQEIVIKIQETVLKKGA